MQGWGSAVPVLADTVLTKTPRLPGLLTAQLPLVTHRLGFGTATGPPLTPASQTLPGRNRSYKDNIAVGMALPLLIVMEHDLHVPALIKCVCSAVAVFIC